MLIVTRREVEELLDLDRLVEAVAGAMADLSAGSVSMPARTAADVTERDAFLGVMPAFVPSLGALTTKLVSVFPHNTDRPSHQAVIVCFDPQTGTPVALVDGTSVTELRTAAGSALSVRLLAREDAGVLAVLGTGVQARAHARAVVRARPIERVRVAGREPAKAEALAGALAGELGLPVEAAGTYREAVEGADVVCACTHSPEPVVQRAWVAPGTHVTSVGYNPAGRELDPELVRDALVVVEYRASALAAPPAGSNDLTWAIRDGVIGKDHVRVEIGELVAGRAEGRTSPDQITLYKSVGVAVQDAAAATLVLQAARERGAGTEIDI